MINAFFKKVLFECTLYFWVSKQFDNFTIRLGQLNKYIYITVIKIFIILSMFTPTYFMNKTIFFFKDLIGGWKNNALIVYKSKNGCSTFKYSQGDDLHNEWLQFMITFDFLSYTSCLLPKIILNLILINTILLQKAYLFTVRKCS